MAKTIAGIQGHGIFFSPQLGRNHMIAIPVDSHRAREKTSDGAGSLRVYIVRINKAGKEKESYLIDE